MRIENEFGVDVPVTRAWQALTDLEGLAPCMPGAQLTGVEGEVYKGRVKVKVGPVISQFTGSARFEEKDDGAHHAVVSAAGKDTRGGGNASARIDLSLHPDGEGTHVSVSTDLNISGKLAQFGAGMIKEISEKLLTQFVHNLEARLHGEPPKAPEPPAAAPAAPPSEPAASAPDTPPTAVNGRSAAYAAPSSASSPSFIGPSSVPGAAGEDDDDPLDLMELAGPAVYRRLLPAAAVAGGVILLVVLVRRVRRALR